MWNVLCGNRLIDKRRKESAQRKHITALNEVKSIINNHTPNQYSFLYSRPKAYQKKQGITSNMKKGRVTYRVRTQF